MGARTLLEFLFPWHQPRAWHSAGTWEMLNAQISLAWRGRDNCTCLHQSGFLSITSVSVTRSLCILPI